MRIEHLPFGITDWATLPVEVSAGITGEARSRTWRFGDLRVRMVEYSAGYAADHWCTKGHVLLCLEGALETTLADGRVFALTAGVGYQVADGAEPHRSSSRGGARLFIVD